MFEGAPSPSGGLDDKTAALSGILQAKQYELDSLKSVLDKRVGYDSLGGRLFSEISLLYPGLRSCAVVPVRENADSGKVKQSLMVLISFNRTISNADKTKLRNWLVERTADTSVQLIFKL